MTASTSVATRRAPGAESTLLVSSSRPYRAPLVDRIVPRLILLYFGAAYYMSLRVVALDFLWIDQQRPLFALVYAVFAVTTITTIAYIFFSLYLLSLEHSAPPMNPPPEVRARTVVYECIDDEGGVGRCFRGYCTGAWKGPRTRHCSVCDRCRVGYDHHCPWFATCVTTEHLLSFLAFLLFVPLSVPIFLSPVFPRLVAHARATWTFSRAPRSPVRALWWDWWPAWVIGIGPIGRASLGWALGYYLFPGEVKTVEAGPITIVVLMAVGLSLIGFTLFASTVYSIVKAETPIESRIRSSYTGLDPRLRSEESARPYAESLRRRFWVPSKRADGSGVVVRTRVDERPYNLGWRRNFAFVWEAWNGRAGRGPQAGLLSLNPTVERRLRYEADLLMEDDINTATSESGEEDDEEVP